MSLLDDKIATLIVYPETVTTDSLGNQIVTPAKDGIKVGGSMVQINAVEQDTQNSLPVYVFRGREFPGGSVAEVDWDGWKFDVVGEPNRRNRGTLATRHAHVTLRARTNRRP